MDVFDAAHLIYRDVAKFRPPLTTITYHLFHLPSPLATPQVVIVDVMIHLIITIIYDIDRQAQYINEWQAQHL